MARFAVKEKETGNPRSPKTVNLAGGDAYQQEPKRELVHLILTNLVKDQFYRSSDESLNRLRELVDQVDPLFAAKAAIYARREFGMRSITHALAAEVAARTAGSPVANGKQERSWVPGFINAVVDRADDASEIAAYYMTNYGNMPTRLKRGLARSLERMSEYELAKYNTGNRMVNLVRLVHPRYDVEKNDPISKLVYEQLAPPETWEVKVSQSGQGEKDAEEKKEAKQQAWAEMVRTNKIGYMALLRNLRNIAKDAPEVLDMALAKIADPDAVRKGRQFPVRYMTAANEVIRTVDDPTARKVGNAIEQALEVSVENVPLLPGDTVVFVDNSGSMHGGGSVGSATMAEVAAIFAASLAKRNNADVIVFSSDAKYVHYNPNNNVVTIASKLMQGIPQGTYLGSAVKIMNKRYDRIIILSDMQTWEETYYGSYGRDYQSHIKLLDLYEKKYGVKPYIYSVDLHGYGTTNWVGGRMLQIAGYSEKIFDLIGMVEQDKDALINKIEQVKFAA
jgi:hypothetical protein